MFILRIFLSPIQCKCECALSCFHFFKFESSRLWFTIGIGAVMRAEKTGLRGFRPGLTLTGLCSLRKNARSLKFRF